MTRLKALDLVGFKSFADRTRFEFPDGITVVVGPNGSGKSNVVDAIKWVLGEQSMRSLRGKNSTDVIFAGSATRKSLNVAEVSLIFDNTNRELPVESDEVQIARRVYRSGESEYLVNGDTSRLRDIRELFSGTGAATEAYSVIEQGRVDALLVASGRDRRIVFEEAAGITRFRARRAEALRRLERTEQNRQRLADIVGEVSSRLHTVTQQAKRAIRWRTMTDTLRHFRISAARQDLCSVDEKLDHISNAVQEARARHTDAERCIASATSRLETLSADERKLLPLLERQRESTTHECELVAAAETKVTLLQSRHVELTKELDRTDTELHQAKIDTRTLDEKITTAQKELKQHLTEAERINALQQEQEHAEAGTQENASTMRRQLDAKADSLTELQHARISLQTHRDQEKARLEGTEQAMSEWHSQIETARGNVAQSQEMTSTWEGNLSTLQQGFDRICAELEEQERSHQETSEKLDAAWQSLASWKAKVEACAERRALIEELIDRHEGLSDASRQILMSDKKLPGLIGAVADLVVADEPWASLVDFSLGLYAQCLVVDGFKPLISGQTFWTEFDHVREALSAGGRVSLLALDSLQDPPAFEPEHEGVVGRLDELISENVSHEDHVQSRLRHKLLGRVWVVESLHHATALAASAPLGLLFITQEGAAISSDGMHEVGSLGNNLALVSRHSEYRSLDERYHELSRSVSDEEANISNLQSELSEIKLQIQQGTSRKHQSGEQIAASRAELGRSRREGETAEQALVEAEKKLKDTEHLLVEHAKMFDEANATLASHDRHIHTAQEDVTSARSALDSLDRSRTEVTATIHQLREERQACEERISTSRAVVESMVGDAAIRRADIEAAERRRMNAKQKLNELELSLLAATSAFSEVAVSAERARDVLANMTDDRNTIASSVHIEDAAIKKGREELAKTQEAIHQLDLEAGEARHHKNRVIERISDDYEIEVTSQTPVEAATDADGVPIEVPDDRQELDTRIEQLRKKLSSMTTVNMEALAEADELTERLQTLESQLQDVTDGKQAIEQLITRIDDESRRLLGETIETVRGHFRELFERVFGGGQADIVLDPELDLLETSVEINARPPGKEPRSISLLSGGEKTMTCVALLLAIFRSRPSPFCVLDEVDAALDEANIDRFVGVLRDFLSSTQFIVVTHSKKTMAAGTTLYGVTMEESGVSKRVSVRFESGTESEEKNGQKAA
ncbi:MAG: chromosome segregation protein SMC [Pirellulales bacterium]